MALEDEKYLSFTTFRKNGDPVSTPAGTSTTSVRRVRTRPSPEQSRQGSGIVEP